MKEDVIGIGLIGAGTVAGYGHLPAIAARDDTRLVMIADISERNLKTACEKYGAEGTLDYEELLDRDDIDAISICTPVDTHREIAEAALEAGKPVFCEKPLASTVEDCWAIVDAEKRTGGFLAVDFHLRLSEDIVETKRHIESGDIGELEVLRFIMNWGCHGIRGEEGRRRARFMRTGGPILDNGVHFLDLARYLSGLEITDIGSEGQWVEPQFRYPGHVICTTRLNKSVLCLVEMSYVYGHTTKDQPSSSRIEIIGSDGAIADGKVYTPEGSTQLPIARGKRFDRIYDEFLRIVRTGDHWGSPIATAEDGAKATEAALEALRLAMEGKPTG